MALVSRLYALVLAVLSLGSVLIWGKTARAHTLQVEPIVVNLRAQDDAITAEFIGNVQDITQSVSVKDEEKRGNAFTAAVEARTEAYFNTNFVLSQNGTPLQGKLQSLKQQGNLDITQSKFVLYLRYPTTAQKNTPLQIKNTMLDYLPNARMVVTTGGLTRTMSYGDVAEIDPSALAQNLVKNIAQFVWLGVEHIFTGYDHMLFIVSLLLLAGSLRGLVKTLTGFTIAHSITLILAALGIVTPPARLVELLIPISIIYVGLENLWFLKKGDLEKAAKTRFWIASGFGLIHGFGFAGNLRAIGLPSGSALFFCLLSFNIGVEIAQVILSAIAFPALSAWKKSATQNARSGGLSWETILKGASIAVCLAGGYFLALVLGLF